MKSVAIIAAIAAITVSGSAFAASAPQTHEPGSPIKNGKFCWVYSDARGHGFWDTCDPNSVFQSRGLSLRGRSESEVSAIENGGGGDGGGGGGGGR
jgi:hypothetical protein